MFTGIIHETPLVAALNEHRLVINSSALAACSAIGDSIAVNGCCLTVRGIEDQLVSFDISHETFAVTTLALLKANDIVNAEAALRASDRLGGHMVSGHIDAKGVIKRIDKKNDFWDVQIALPKTAQRLLVQKGSIAIDGVSLTINSICDFKEDHTNLVSLTLIPETIKKTIFCHAKEGQEVNVEYDMLVKNIAAVVSQYFESHPAF